MKDEIFKQVFADFRGLIASDQAVEFADDGFFKGDKPPTWGQKAKEKFLPLIQHRDPVEQTEYECVMNYMLDGRAFYMSTLGPQAPSPAKQRTPVEFIVYAHQCYNDTTVVNKWQLGRLVSQLLLLGTLRLSALKDIKSLHKAGQLLEQLDEITRAARDAIALAEVEASASKANRGSISKRDQPAGPSVEEAMIEFLFRAHKKLNDVTGNFLDATGSGLTFRIERSRYYVKQFEDNVEMLRIKRVEGDQPYDLFIKRRLGSEFDFIDRLGIRYERAVRTMETLDQDRSRGLQMEISGETNSIQSDIQTIQAGGEAILLAFLVPYYVSHLLVLIFGEGASYIPIMTVNVWLIGFAVAIGRYSKKLTLSTAVWFCFRLLVLLALLFPVERQILYWLNASKQPENAGSLHSGTGMQRQIQPPMTAPDENRKSAPAEPPTSEPKP
jgi:hypothetical protein